MPIGILAATCILAVAVMVVVWLRRPLLTEPRLDGMWQSDGEASIAEWRKVRPVNEKQLEALTKLFGKMKITFTGNIFTTDLDGTLESGTFQITRKEDGLVVVKARVARSITGQVFKIRFIDDNTYWVYLDQASTWECFRRVK